MSLKTRKPPYSAQEIEKMAQGLASGSGFGAWLSTKEGTIAFHKPYMQRPVLDRCNSLHNGTIYLFEWMTECYGRSVKKGIPVFNSVHELDYKATCALLTRVADIERRLGRQEVPDNEQILFVARSQDVARAEVCAGMKGTLSVARSMNVIEGFIPKKKRKKAW